MPTETRQLPAFTSVAVSDGIRLHATIGSPASVKVVAPEGILPLIETVVENASLRVHAVDSYQSSETVQVSVVAPQIDGIALSGGSPGEVTGLEQGALSVQLSGGARLTAVGAVEDLQAQLSGGAQGLLAGLSTARATISTSGASQVNRLD